MIQKNRKDDVDDITALEDLDEDDAKIVSGESQEEGTEDQSDIEADVEAALFLSKSVAQDLQDKVQAPWSPCPLGLVGLVGLVGSANEGSG